MRWDSDWSMGTTLVIITVLSHDSEANVPHFRFYKKPSSLLGQDADSTLRAIPDLSTRGSNLA
jgi:hypothetical protein